jgi:predicted metal-dependent enzyme (double-stranded beta helix superfamily)
MTFDIDQFVADCRSALAADGTHKSIREVVARAVSEPASILKTLGEPTRGELNALYRSPDLTILKIAWAPYMTLMPHNHNMWAIIGIYTGREDNIFWRRIDARCEEWPRPSPVPYRRRGGAAVCSLT